MVTILRRLGGVFSQSFLVGLVVMLFLGGYASANEGVFLLGNDAQQLGRASSGVASPRSSCWSYMNPAGMVDLERRFDFNFYTIFTEAKLHPNGLIGNPFYEELESEKIPTIASTGFILPLEVGTLGGGIFVPSGSMVEYSEARNWVTYLFQGNRDRKLTYQHIRGVLSYAYEFDNGWALGLSLQGSFSRIHTNHLTTQLHTAWQDNQWDDAWGAGFGLGIYKHWDKWAVGAGYTSRHWTQAFHKYGDLLTHPVDMPQILQLGVAYKIHPDVELTLDYKWLNWEDVANYGNRLAEGGFNWDDQNGVKAGVEWTVNDKWTLMAGYSYANTPIDKDHVFLSSLVPVTVEQHYTGGFTYRFSDRDEIHAVGLYAPPHEMTDTGNGDIFSILGKGSSLSSSAISFILGYSHKW